MTEKMVYADGSVFDSKGMVVTATYANGKTRDVTEYITISDEKITAENTTLTLSFEHVLYHNVEDGTAIKSGVTSATPITTLTVSVGEEVQLGPVLGDVNLDGTVDLSDADFIADYYNEQVELSEEQLKLADVNGDKKVDIADANLVCSYYNKVITDFPVNEQ